MVVVTAAVILLSGKCNAQVQHLRLENLSVEDGLSQASVNYVYQDKDGFVWVSTDAGIQAFDGYNFKIISGPDDDFSSFSAYKIDETDDGLTWLQVYGKGLYTFDKITQTFELVLKEDAENVISHYYHGDNGKLWIATTTAIGYLDRKTKTFIKVADLQQQLGSKNSIYYLIEKQNILYIGTSNGVFVYHIATKQLLKLPPISSQNTTTENFSNTETAKAYTLMVIDQTLFIGTNDGVFSLDVTNIQQFYTSEQTLPKYELILSHIAVWQFYLHNNLLLIGANEGLYEFNLDTEKSRFLLTFDLFNPSISNNYVRTLMVDKNGLYWMGSPSDGLFLWDPKSENVQNYGYQKGNERSLSNSQVSSVLPHKTQKNKLWVGTFNGLNLIDLESQQVERIIQPADAKTAFTENNIYALFHGLDNQLWLSTSVGLKLYDIDKKSIVPLPFNNNINQLLANELYLAHVENDYLWYSTETKLFRVNLATGQLETLPEISTKIGNNNIWSFLGHISNNPDEFWFTTNLALWKFNLQQKVLTKVYQHPEISDAEWSSIDSVIIDESKGMAWIAFSAQGLIGVSLETNEAIHYFQKSNSIIDNNIYGVQQDDAGDIWVSTHKGIFVLNPKTLFLRRFGVNQGLIGDEFNSNAFAKLADGKLVYGAINGLSIFDPIQLKNTEQAKPLDILITNIELLSRDIVTPFFFKNNQRFALEHDDVGIRVDFTTFDYSNTKEALFEYRLNNQDFTPMRDNHIVFPSLRSGEHKLQIRAKSRLSGQYSAPTNLIFTVSYAPWRSPVAYSLYALFFFSLFAFWLRKRAQQQAELLAMHEEVKSRENRLQLALKGSNSFVWDWHSENNNFTASRFKTIQSDSGAQGDISFTDFFSKIHPDDGASFVATWQRFIENADITETFSCTYRLKDQYNEWLWYKDLGKIVELDRNNRPTRVTGSYTNITQSKVAEERAQYYGEAFRQTKDWVIIINQDFTKVTSNAAIREVFGWEQEEFPFHQSLLGFDKAKIRFYTNIVLGLGADQHWRGEELITSATGENFHVIVNISVGSNSNGNLHYIFVFTDITAQKLAEKELRYMANYDHLTGLPNRALLLERVEQAISRAARKKQNIALFFIDLDRFKQINDTFGHDFGDILLIEITKRLTEVLRQDDTIARQGGDEFVVLLERFTSVEKLAKIAQKIIHITEEPFKLKETVVSIGCSIGIAIYPGDGMSSTELFKNSDIAMYSAKQNGRNTFQFFEPSMNDAAAKRLEQEANIKQAAKEHLFINHYQPIVDAHIGNTVGVEMLMRWPTDNGMIPPDEFIPLAEDLNLIIPMTEVALNKALVDLIEWRKCRSDFYLSINISASHFIKGQLVSYITQMLQRHNLPTSAIRIELTESAFISEPDIAIEQMTRLKKLGIQLSLDDFGTGYSSLSYLKSFPIDVIKIDRSFISNIGSERADEAIIETIIILAENLGMSCVAEGAETKEQITFLVSRNCHFIQGYFYSKALPNVDILSMLEENLDDYPTMI